MAKLCVITGDQLSQTMSSLSAIDKHTDHVLMAEVNSEATYVKHHKKKIAFVFSAMRHFAKELSEKGYQVHYVDYRSENNQGSLSAQIQYFCQMHQVDEIILAHPGEYRLWQAFNDWQSTQDIPLTVLNDNRFYEDKSFFENWAQSRKQLRMEYFYRELRKAHNILMDGDKPIGGKWNFDSENRKKLPKGQIPPKNKEFAMDSITQEVIELVQEEFSDHFGDVEGFHYAVTRDQALEVLHTFIVERLENFGDFQDAMAQDEPWLYHSHISLYINTGLITPHEAVQAAEAAYFQKKAPLNAVEGFIRQILGWREYVRGLYWFYMPQYETQNYLAAKRSLPAFFWTAETDMNCLQQCIQTTKEHAYAHHIQRLMVLGNFALLTGLSPAQVNEWYLIVYADAYEWVEMPNVTGMILFADGGKLASKPYAASGAYINKMSNYCQYCTYSVKEKFGQQACPFNYLYWHFIDRHRDKFEANPRMAMIYRTFKKMDPAQVEKILQEAELFLQRLDNNEKV